MAHNFSGNSNKIFRPSLLQQVEQIPANPFTNTPFSMDSMPWQRIAPSTDIMQFEACTNLSDRRLLHVKRKSDLPTTATPPAKQFISEEKISAHFNSLHISNNAQNTNSSLSSLEEALMDPTTSNAAALNNCHEYRVTAKELEDKLLKLRNANRITVCEDILKLHDEQKRVSLLPEALINRIEKPCTALVLWQPPPVIELLHRQTEEELQKTKNFNNETSNQDVMEDVEFSDTEFSGFVDNNNTFNVNYNDISGQMDEDL